LELSQSKSDIEVGAQELVLLPLPLAARHLVT